MASESTLCEKCKRPMPGHWDQCRYCLTFPSAPLQAGRGSADGDLCSRCSTLMHPSKLKGDQTVGRRYVVQVLKCYQCGEHEYFKWKDRRSPRRDELSSASSGASGNQAGPLLEWDRSDLQQLRRQRTEYDDSEGSSAAKAGRDREYERVLVENAGTNKQEAVLETQRVDQ